MPGFLCRCRGCKAQCRGVRGFALGVACLCDWLPVAQLPSLAACLLHAMRVGDRPHPSAPPQGMAVASAQAVACIGVIIAGGRTLLRPIYRRIADMGNADVFAALTLLVVLGTSVLTQIAGLSLALGAFLVRARALPAPTPASPPARQQGPPRAQAVLSCALQGCGLERFVMSSTRCRGPQHMLSCLGGAADVLAVARRGLPRARASLTFARVCARRRGCSSRRPSLPCRWRATSRPTRACSWASSS